MRYKRFVCIGYHIRSVDALAYPLITDKRHCRRKEYKSGHQSAEYSLSGKSDELSQRNVKIPAFHAAEEIEYQKYCLPCEEIVVHAGHKRCCKSKNALPSAVYALLQSNEHEGEKSRDVLKMIEKNVVYLKSRERIEQRACQRRIFSPHESSDVCIGGESSCTVLHRKHQRHRVKHEPARQYRRKPEKRAAEKVKGI